MKNKGFILSGSLIFLMMSVFISCGPKQDKVEKIMEDGIKVVINHLEPYKVKGKPNNLFLEEEFRIDSEKDEIAETGLTDISNRGFGVDSEGSIYFIGLCT